VGGHDPIEIRPHAVYTIAEVCQLLRLGNVTVRRLVRSGQLPATRLGGPYRILGSALLAALRDADGTADHRAR
jgi:excisionase family DNA binding protein